MALTKAQIKEQLLESGQRLVRVRDQGQLIKDAINQVEPQPIPVAQTQIQPGLLLQGQDKRTN